MGSGDGSRSESDHAGRNAPAPRFLARSACRQRRSLCCLPASCDELGDLLSALLSDLLEVVGAMTLRGRLAALLSDLLVELRAMSLRRRRASTATCLGDRHRALVPRHRVTLSRPFKLVVCCPG